MRLARRACLAALLAAPLLASQASAAEPPYLPAGKLDLAPFLPAPMQAGSDAEKAAQARIIALQKASSPERIAQAVADAKEDIFTMYGRTLGPAFAPEKLPRASVFFQRLLASEGPNINPLKKVFARQRPFLANPEIKALVPESRSGAYPSGHATRATLGAILLTAMLPEKRQEIWDRAKDYTRSRLIGGMHYPEDIDAGRRAGTAIAAVLLADPAFRADADAARAELRAAFGM